MNSYNEKYYICPNCKSENIQKIELIYLNGVDDVNGTGIGVGCGGFFGGWHGGKSQIKLSQVVAPQNVIA